jgi:hypothetical protein
VSPSSRHHGGHDRVVGRVAARPSNHHHGSYYPVAEYPAVQGDSSWGGVASMFLLAAAAAACVVRHGVGVTQHCGSRAASPVGPTYLGSMRRSSAGPVMLGAVVKTASLVVLLVSEACYQR